MVENEVHPKSLESNFWGAVWMTASTVVTEMSESAWTTAVSSVEMCDDVVGEREG
jgi:hypothetical protein